MATTHQLFTNNAGSTLNGTLAIGGTFFNVSVGHGTRFPTPGTGEYFHATLFELDGGGNEINYEIMRCTAISGDTLTVQRDIEGVVVAAGGTSGGWAYPAAPGINPSQVVYVELRHTAYAAENNLTKDGNLAGLDSPATARGNLGLGSLATQAADAVNITGGTLAGVTIASATISAIDSLSTFADNADATKQARFELSGVTAGQTRVLSVPDTNGTLATIDAPQTLTNKTLALGSNPVSGTKAQFDAACSDGNFAFDGHGHAIAEVTGLQTALDAKQATLVSGTNIKTINGVSVLGSGDLTVGGSSTDHVARDQIALTNMKLMLSTAVTTGPLVQGKQWELASDDWAASSTNESYVSATPNYYTQTVNQSMVAAGTGTAIGDMTNYGGLAAAFDGVTSQASLSCAADAGGDRTTAYIGKDWGVGNTKTISGFVAYGSNNQGFNEAGTDTVTIELQGSTDNFSSSVVSLGSATVANAAGCSISKLSGITTTTAYRYHRVKITSASGTTSSQNKMCAELQFYEGTGVNDATLIPPAAVSVSTAPPYMDLHFLYKDDSGSAVLGTDFTVELSRDNGTTYTAATLSTVASYDGTYSVIKARADVSEQPSGTSMLCRVKAINNKAQRFAAPNLSAE